MPTPTPKIFGHLYVAIFSNGTVKAGMSANDPQSRITSHAHAGKAFGISMESSFLASIYTNDVRAREKLMHKEILQHATQTAGREWFKFANFEDALNFASTYLHKAERMSFAERPSQKEIDRAAIKQAAASGGWIKLLSLGSLETEEKKTQREIAKAEAFLDTLDARLIFILASKMIDSDESNFDLDAPSQVPVLSTLVSSHWAAFYANHQSDSPLSACSAEALAAAEPGDCIDMTLNLKVARAILSAAMLYPEFFHQACLGESAKLAEVAV